ncbi:hypothetical protein HNO91_11205 [Pseudomonas corrugata]|uniref:Uncharacterized protein n=1 Tax=Pseudomonas corrugata TaxID=47879 RepID=A0A7Y6DH97_9PSED|nr:hypothetical protein [Pseudomonas corrugata]NUT86998.1 hypothetical protein [Pseudomonas corrugata]
MPAMLTQPRKNPAPLALLDPDIPGRTEQQLPSGEWGLNFAAVQGNFPNKGLKVYIEPWAGPMGIGDNVKLLLDGDQVDQHTITQPTEVGERVTLWVAPGRLQTGPYELAYAVKRPSQAEETYTPPVRLYVKLELPGGQDTDPDPGSHSELYMYIDPALVEDGVDDDAARNGVDIIIKAKPGSASPLPYPNITEGDLIYLSWGGVEVISDPVSQVQIDDPDNNPIIVHVTEAIIRDEAGDSGPEGLAVTFKIHDRVNNASEDWCPETRLVVDTGQSRLIAPILEQANGNVLNLDTLGDEALQLQVWADDTTLFAKDDVIIMRVKGTTLDGGLIEETARQTVEKNPPVVVDVLLPNSAARALAKTQAVFSYKLERGGTVLQQSKGRFINIIGEPNLLAAPIAEDAQNGALDPDLTSTRIRIPFDERIEEGMAIELKWFGTRADLSSYEPELEWYFPSRDEVEAKEDFFIPVEGRHLKTLEGGTLDLSYNLLSDEDGEIVSRGSRHAATLNVGEPQLELVPAIVLGEQDGALEPDDLPNGISKVTCPAPVANPSKPKDVVSWQLLDAEGEQLFEDFKTLNSLNAGKAVEFPLNATFVQQYFEALRGEKLTVNYNILRFETGRYSYSNPLEFIVGTALELDPPSVKEANGATLKPFNAKDTLTIEVPVNADLLPDDKLKVIWTGAPGTPAEGSYTSGETLVSDGLDIEIPNSVVAFNLGKSVVVSYEVIRGNDKPIPSGDFDLAVEVFAQDDLLEAKPLLMAAANNGEGPKLDLSAITSDTPCLIGRWPLIALDQDVWLRLRGTKADGTPGYNFAIYAPPPRGPSVDADWISQGVHAVNAPYAYLKELKHGSELTVEFKADFSKTTNEAEAQTFPIRTYVVSTLPDVLPPPDVVEADANHAVDPSVLSNGITVQVLPFDGMLVGYDITMTFEGTADGSATQTKRVERIEPIDYAISQATLLPNSDRTVNVFYQVFNNGQPITERSLHYPLKVLGLEWNSFAINGWNTSAFQPTTGFDSASFQRTARRAVGTISYTSSRPDDVTVESGTGRVSFRRAWTGSVTMTARDGAMRTITYTLNAPAKWFLLETLAKRDIPEHYAFVQSNAGKGYRPALYTDWSPRASTRQIGWLWNEWGDLTAYTGWPAPTGQDQNIWLVSDPGGTPGWRGGSFLNRPTHWSINNHGQGRHWTICYRLNP